MNTYASLIAGSLEEALRGGEPVLEKLDDIVVELCACDTESRPAAVIAELFKSAGRASELARWLATMIGPLATPAEVPAEAPAEVGAARRRLRLANTLFDLAGMLTFEAADQDKIVASLGMVWSHHRDWRRWAADLGAKTGMHAWLDPATVAETSPLMLKGKTHLEIRRHLEEVDQLAEHYHPLMRDYCYYMHLRRIAERCNTPPGVAVIEGQRWPDVAGFAMARIVANWFERKPFFVTFTCHQLRAGAGPESWPVVAERVYEHTHSTLVVAHREELAELLGQPRPSPPALETLAGSAADRVSISLTPLRRHAGGWQ